MKRTPLYEEHVAAGARMVEFAGWEMPIQYQGIIDEHLAVRSAAGMFDVSHMGDVLISGPHAEDLLLRLLTNDVRGLEFGKGIYSHILNEAGMILDDTIVYRLGQDEYLMVPNASTTEMIVEWMFEHRTDQLVQNVSDRIACIALQGPKAAEIAGLLCKDIPSIKHFHCMLVDLPFTKRSSAFMWGGKALVSRTGYTGEDGFELMFDASLAAEVWRRIIDIGRPMGLALAGLGARDTLRLEMGYLLSGTDFDGHQSTVQTGPEFVLKWDHDFIGREALRAMSRVADLSRLTCFELEEKGIPRHGYVLEHEGKIVGHVTSGTFSPSMHIGIGMGYLPPRLTSPGSEIDVVIRGSRLKARVVRPPFYKR